MAKEKEVKGVALVRLSMWNQFIEVGEKVSLEIERFKKLYDVGAVDFEGEPIDLGDENGSLYSGKFVLDPDDNWYLMAFNNYSRWPVSYFRIFAILSVSRNLLMRKS